MVRQRSRVVLVVRVGSRPAGGEGVLFPQADWRSRSSVYGRAGTSRSFRSGRADSKQLTMMERRQTTPCSDTVNSSFKVESCRGLAGAQHKGVRRVHLDPHNPGRDPRIDVLRGGALVLIAIDHVPGNALAEWTPHAWGYSDLAEVFVFLSGYVCGVSYRRVQKEHGWLSSQIKASVRAAQLIVAMFATQWLIRFFDSAGRGEEALIRIRDVLWSVATGDIDGNLIILRLYAILLLYLPAWLVIRKQLPLVATLSSLLAYAACQVAAGGSFVEGFSPWAWQLLFFLGVAGSEPHSTLRTASERFTVRAVALFVFQTAFICRMSEVPLDDRLAAKATLAPLRVLHFLSLAILFTTVAPAAPPTPPPRPPAPPATC